MNLSKFKKYKHIIIDLDETLVTLLIPWSSVVKEINLFFKKKNSKSRITNLWELGSKCLNDYIKYKKALDKIQYKYEKEYIENKHAWKKAHLKIIHFCKKNKIKYSIFSNNFKKFIKIICKKENIHPKLIIGKGDVLFPKPNPEGLLKILKKLKLKSSEVLYIGDSKYDAIPAKKARIKFMRVKHV